MTLRGERRLPHLPQVLRLGRGMKVTTCFSDMSVAVNIGLRGPQCSGGGLGPFLVRREVPSPFSGLKAVPEGVKKAG